MNLTCIHRLLAMITLMFLAGPGSPFRAAAQTDYENYVFTTLAGPVEATAGFDGTNSAARFNFPYGVAVDSAHNVYVADTFSHTIRKIDPAGGVSTLAGLAGTPGTNDGPGSLARFNTPYGIAVDGNGNVYVGDTGNHTIRKITAAGVVSTLAGLAGVSGSVNATGGAARFYQPEGVAVDGQTNVYVADTYNHAIRKITTAGVVTTLAGLGGTAGTNNGTGTAARFDYPSGVAVDSHTNVYVADTYNHAIRKITAAGVVTTLAGLAGTSGTNDGSGSAARFYKPLGVYVGGNSNIFVGDTYNQTIRQISPAGVVSTLAGLAGTAGNTDATGGGARFDYPCGVTVDSGTNIYVADYANSTIRKITVAAEVTTPAGYAGGAGSGDGTGGGARFNHPDGLAVDPNMNIYVGDHDNHVIRKISPDGGVTTLAGLAGTPGTNDGTGSAARFDFPAGVAVDNQTNVYVADTYNHIIRKITPAGGVITLAGLAGNFGTNDGSGSAARFFYPSGVAVDANTNVYVADSGNSTIRKITPDGGVTTLAGLATATGTNNGTGAAARFNWPMGLAIDNDGSLIVGDTLNQLIRKVTTAGVVTTLAGSTNTGNIDGTGAAARFYNPYGVAADSSGNIYVSDSGNDTVRKITAAGGVATLGGMTTDYGCADGTGSGARFDYPEGIAVDGAGNVYVADADNHAIRKGYPAPSDRAVVDLPYGKVGTTRQLDVTNATSTSWSWRFIRYPAGSAAQLSSATAKNPTFTPDVADLYILRFEGVDNSGRTAIGTVSVVADATPPTLAITSPTNSQRWSNAVFTVTGTASDDLGVASVWCRDNNGGWVNASGTTSWNDAMALTPGTNVIQAYALDASGNASPTGSVSLDYVVTGLLVVQTNGSGTFNSNYNGKLLEIGRGYSLTATAATGFAFTNWTGGTALPLGLLTNGATVQFLMQSNLVLQANFADVAAPTNTITSPTANQRVTNAVFTVTGTARDNVGVGAVWYQLNGAAWMQAKSTNYWTNWTAGVALPAATNVLRAYAVDASGNFSATNSVTFVSTNAFKLTFSFTTSSPLGAAGLDLSLDASPGLAGHVETSTNLVNWTSLTNFTGTNSLLHFRDGTATNRSEQFYRAVVP